MPAAQFSVESREPEPDSSADSFARPPVEVNRQMATFQKHRRSQPYCKALPVTLRERRLGRAPHSSPSFYFSDGGFLPKAATAKIGFNARPHPNLLPQEKE